MYIAGFTAEFAMSHRPHHTCSVTYDFLRYINILTYLLTYML